MHEVKEIRRARMLLLAAEMGSLEALAERTGTSARHLSQIKNRWKGRGMGNAVARRFETRLQKSLGWMDYPLPQSGPETDSEDSGNKVRDHVKVYRLEPHTQSRILDLFDQLTRAQQEKFLSAIEDAVDNNKAIMREIGAAPREG